MTPGERNTRAFHVCLLLRLVHHIQWPSRDRIGQSRPER